jgi:hypothetical protein
MPKRPILIFPKFVPVAREKFAPSYIPTKRIGRRWQTSNVGQALQQLQAAVARHTLELSTAAPGAVAEEVLVLETAGNVSDFVAAVRRIPGLEWLVSFDAPQPDEEEEAPEEVEDDDFAGTTNRLFALATNAQALAQLLSLWNRYESGKKLERPFGVWSQLFAQLRKVRRWSVEDRLHGTGIVEFWKDALDMGEPSITFAAELWFRSNPSTRRARFASLQAAAVSLGGKPRIPHRSPLALATRREARHRAH